jgi:hypothetical protein
MHLRGEPALFADTVFSWTTMSTDAVRIPATNPCSARKFTSKRSEGRHLLLTQLGRVVMLTFPGTPFGGTFAQKIEAVAKLTTFELHEFFA